MTRSNTNCRTALVAPTASDSIREAHSYEYDNNGNILYVNTLRVKPDMTTQPDTVQRAREERFRWDEENRLTALSQNGYVSNYWYDANGDRVIKEHGENMAVFVNSRQDGCVTQTGRYSVYPNPYYSYGDDGRYTKHIYIGSERVLSQVGGVYGEPRLLDVAGHDVRIKVDYPQIRASQDSVMEAAYSHFDLPYNGTDHDNFGRYKFDLPGYWNGSLQTPRDSEEDGDEGTPARAQELLYYYHTDHLGSSTLVTDGNGQLVQQIEYLPYGEVFLERQNGDYTTPYKFNGKELDEETGLYYYGARYMNPRLSIWYGTDPLQEKYPNISTYTYCVGNPISAIDIGGKLIIFINGFHTGDGGQAKYWEGKDILFKNLFYDRHSRYYDGSMNGMNGIVSGSKNVNNRILQGFKMGYSHAKSILLSLNKGEKIRFVTHSMGAAYAKGFINGLQLYAQKNNINIKDLIQLEVDLAPYQPSEQSADESVRTIVIAHKHDHIAGSEPMPGAENHVTRENESPWNIKSEHSITSFTEEEIRNYVPTGKANEGGNNKKWEQNASK